MNTRKFKILCDGDSIGFIFISDDHPTFPNCKAATIWPFELRGTWTANDLELVGHQLITDIFEIDTSDDEVKDNLVQRSNINPDNCNNFIIMEY